MKTICVLIIAIAMTALVLYSIIDKKSHDAMMDKASHSVMNKLREVTDAGKNKSQIISPNNSHDISIKLPQDNNLKEEQILQQVNTDELIETIDLDVGVTQIILPNNGQDITIKLLQNGKLQEGKSLYQVNKFPLFSSTNIADHEKGVCYLSYRGWWNWIPDFSQLSAIHSGQTAAPNLHVAGSNEGIALQFYGYIKIETSGLYNFYTNSDDGSRLYVNQQLVVNNDGAHGENEEEGSIALEKGFHFINLDFFEKSGGEYLSLSYSGPNIVKSIIPIEAFYHPKSWNCSKEQQERIFTHAPNCIGDKDNNGLNIDFSKCTPPAGTLHDPKILPDTQPKDDEITAEPNDSIVTWTDDESMIYSGIFYVPSGVKAYVSQLYTFYKAPVINSKITIIPLGVGANIPPFDLAITESKTRARESCSSPSDWWEIKVEEILLQDFPYTINTRSGRRIKYPFKVAAIYPAREVHNIKIEDLSQSMLPEGIPLSYVFAAIDTDADKKPDLLILEFCCSSSEDACDYICGKTYKKIQGVWKEINYSRPC
jgi:hypothetical protein